MESDGERGFWLCGLRVETVLDGRTPVCRHVEGEYFRVIGESLVFEGAQQKVSMSAPAAPLPRQRADREDPPDPRRPVAGRARRADRGRSIACGAAMRPRARGVEGTAWRASRR